VIAAQRRNLIAEIVRADGAVSIAVLAQRLDVSQVTVRRDLDFLASLGLVERAHGGATAGAQAAEQPYVEKVGQATAEKASIARLAASLVKDGDVIAVGPGTTTEAFARELGAHSGLTVVTNSLLVANVFVDSAVNEVIIAGGELRGSIRATVGDAAARTFRGIHADRAFLSGNGLDAEFGLSTPNMIVAETDRTIAGCAKQLVVLADHTKLGVRTAVQTVATAGISHVVTDGRSDGAVLHALAASGIVLHVAGAAA
jgi:DeoR/GlpR family transcriptional regulator of sugar metabolism